MRTSERFRHLLLLTSVVVLSGCGTHPRTPPTTRAECSLYLASYFRDEPVTVFADRIRVFSGRITTEASSGVAKYLSIPTQGSRLEFRIETPANGLVLAETVDLRRGRYISVSRDFRTRQLRLTQQATAFLYD
jgi:hypothetical protein